MPLIKKTLKTMTLNKATKFFEELQSETSRNSEIKFYQEFIQILSRLKKRILSETEIHAIELELDALDLNSKTENNKKYYKKALGKFKKYLKTKFSLIPKGYYTAIGMSLGMCFGVAFGSLINENLGISTGLTIGLFIGLLIGGYMDGQAKDQGRVI